MPGGILVLEPGHRQEQVRNGYTTGRTRPSLSAIPRRLDRGSSAGWEGAPADQRGVRDYLSRLGAGLKKEYDDNQGYTAIGSRSRTRPPTFLGAGVLSDYTMAERALKVLYSLCKKRKQAERLLVQQKPMRTREFSSEEIRKARQWEKEMLPIWKRRGRLTKDGYLRLRKRKTYNLRPRDICRAFPSVSIEEARNLVGFPSRRPGNPKQNQL